MKGQLIMKAVILSGGLGTRLRPFTEAIPKPLLPIGEKAIMELQIERLRLYGFDEIYLATNYKSDYVEHFFGDGSRYNVKLKISKEDKPLGTAGPVKLLKDTLSEEPFIVMNGDILSTIDLAAFYSFACSNDSLLNVTIKEIITPYEFGNIFFENDLVTGIQEKKNFVTYALAGIYVMKPAIFDLIPDNEYYGMDKLILQMLDKHMPISKYEIKEYWLDIGRIDSYEEANKVFSSLNGSIKDA